MNDPYFRANCLHRAQTKRAWAARLIAEAENLEASVSSPLTLGTSAVGASTTLASSPTDRLETEARNHDFAERLHSGYSPS